MKRLLPFFSGILLSGALFAQAPVANFLADTNFLCAGQSISFFDMSTNGPTSWSWSFPGAVPSTSTVQNPTVNYPNAGVFTVVLVAANSNGSDTMTRVNYITVNNPPTTSNAGPDQNICITTTQVTLAANTPSFGTGQWILINGTGTFANSNSPTTTVTGMSVGVNTYQWTISNDPCTPSFDQVVINVDDVPTPANAGPDQQLCSTTTGALAGNTPTVGTGTWTLVSGSGTPTNPNQPNSPVTGLAPGPNVFQWTTSNGNCTSSSDQVTLNVNNAPNIQITPNIASICIGSSIPLTASGGITYSWSPAAGLSATTGATVTATPTTTTTYFCTGTDPNGCTGSIGVTIFVNNYPTVSVSPTSANVCSNAPILLVANGAPGFSWTPATGLSSTTGSAVTALPTTVTTYSVIGSNNGCNDTATVTLTPIPAPTATVSPTSALICNGGNAVLTAGGGISYSWMPATNLSSTTGSPVTASPTTSTTYSVVATAANGCSDTAVALVAVNQPPNTSVTPSSPSVCNGDSVLLTASGASFYSWAPATGLSSTTGSTVYAFPSVTTTYTVTGSAPPCTNSVITMTVTVNPAPSVSVSPTTVSICMGSFVNLTASGASSYSWSPSTGLSSTTGAVVTANPTTATTYFVTGTNSSGCSATVITNVNVNPVPNLNTSTTPVVCGNGNNGTATVIPNGGTPPFTYQWNDPFNQTTGTAFGLSAGNYSVLVTDANGCSQTANVTVSSINSMAMNLVYSNVLCNGGTNGAATVTVTGGSAPYTYSWSDPLGQNTAMADSLAAGTYTVIVADSNGCMQSVSVTITQPSALALTTTSIDGQCNNPNGSASVSVSGGTAPYSYSWSNGSTAATTGGVGAGQFVVTITDNNGCTTMDTASVANVQSDGCLFVPNAFSPNDDGDHDTWVIANLSMYSNVKVEIYNRWGNKVYENLDYKNDWNGVSQDGKKLPGGVYYYVIDYNSSTQPKAEGTLTLIR